MGQAKKLRFILLCNGPQLQLWQYNCLKEVLSLGFVEPVLIVQNANEIPNQTKTKKILTYPFRLLLYKLSLKFKKHKQQKSVNWPIELNSVKTIQCKTWLKGKYSEYFYDEDLKLIKEQNADFILRFGFNILRGEILNAAKFGVWSYHHGDELNYRGGPPAFWEVYNNENTCGSVLQRITEKLDGGIILKKGTFAVTNHSWHQTLDNMYNLSSQFVKQVCIDIFNNTSSYLYDEPSTTKAKIYTFPGNFIMISYRFKIISRKIKFHFNDLFKQENWKIGIIEQPIDSVIKSGVKEKINWIEHCDKNSYLADSFGYEQNNELQILCEDYSYQTGRGSIRNQNYKTGEYKLIASNSQHYSYPFTFQWENKYFVLPECSSSGKINLYELNKTGELYNEKTLIENVNAFDPSLLYYNNKWWLFFTTKQFDSNTCLFIYHANTLYGEYIAHENNPVKADITGSRMAGNFVQHLGDYYRPAQNCGKTYGKSIKIFKILYLDEKSYKEEELVELNGPSDGLNHEGFHTLSHTKNHVLFDVKAYRFNFPDFKRKLGKKLGLGKAKKLTH